MRRILLFMFVIAVLFILAESALLSVVQTPCYGNDPRVEMNTRAR